MTQNNTFSSNRIFMLFIAAHLVIWTLVPSLINHNLPIDVIEGLAWGNEGQWGYHKHPALSPWLMDVFARATGSADWAQYLLSQLSVCTAFIGMWLLAKDYLTPFKALMSVLLLEGIYYHGYSSPEFNANVILLPLWSLAIYFFYKAVESKRLIWWLALGGAASLGILGKYFTGFLLISMLGYLILTPKGRKQFKTIGPYAALLTMILLLLPHLMWMVETGFSTLKYGVNRAGAKSASDLSNHFVYPIKFFVSQFILLIPPLLMLAAFGFKRELKDTHEQNRQILAYLALGPAVLILGLSAILGWKLRSMWGTPLFLLSGLMLMLYWRPVIDPVRLKRFKAVFLFFALIGPIAYIAVYGIRPMVKEDGKRTQFAGPEIATVIAKEWQNRYPAKTLDYIIGDVWRAGNVAYYLPLSPGTDKRTASVYIDGNVEVSPWIDPQEVFGAGAVLLWKEKTDDPVQDPRFMAFKAQYPTMILMAPMTQNWDSWFKDKDMVIHWAILPPQE